MIFRKKRVTEQSTPSLVLKELKAAYNEALLLKAEMSNVEFIRHKYHRTFGRYPDLDNPKLYSEKIQWMKLYYNNPLYARCSDKLLVRRYVERKGYGHLLNELLGVYGCADEIDTEKLPDKFVIKNTNGSGMSFFCTHKAGEHRCWGDWKELMNYWLKLDYSLLGRELHYTYVKPRLICEKFLENRGGYMYNYRIYCFDGEPRMIQFDYGHSVRNPHVLTFYDPQWKRMDIRRIPAKMSIETEKPEGLDGMLAAAKALSADFPHVRVDMYQVGDRIYFGGLTMTPGNGFSVYEKGKGDEILGGWFRLPDSDCPYVVK